MTHWFYLQLLALKPKPLPSISQLILPVQQRWLLAFFFSSTIPSMEPVVAPSRINVPSPITSTRSEGTTRPLLVNRPSVNHITLLVDANGL
ncbi:hypothetical protein ACFX19_038595 [Malus domestica]